MRRILFSMLALAAMTPVATTAIAQETTTAAAAVTPKVGQVLRDVTGRRLAPIESVQNGAVTVILDMRMYRIPTDTLSVSDKGLQTSLKRADLR